MAEIITQPTLSASDHSAGLRRAVMASTIGTAIEWYDFFLYGIAAGLIFGKLYFPNEQPLTATLAAFGTFFIGFVGRPIGAALFGHFGDRVGRKATLIATLLCTGISTFLIAFVPTYESIGIWGAVLLTLLRMVQGIGVGGEWGGSVLLAMEWSRHDGQRGLMAAWPQFGSPCGLFLANLAILAFSAWSGDQFAAWGWRIPFALSIVLVGIGLWIRLGVLEPPVFEQVCRKNQIERAPVLEVIKKQPREFCFRHCFGRPRWHRTMFSRRSFSPTRSARCTCHAISFLQRCSRRRVCSWLPYHCQGTSPIESGVARCICSASFSPAFTLSCILR